MSFIVGRSCHRLLGFVATAILMVAMASVANASIELAKWTFETSVPTTAGPFTAEAGVNAATSSALGLHADAATAYSNPVGNGSSESFSSTRWAIGDYYQFSTSSLGYENIRLAWSQGSSNEGPREFNLLYDFGSGFTLFGSLTVIANASPNPVWSSGTHQALYDLSFDLSAITGLDNQSSIVFRLVDKSTVSANGGTVTTSGTNRVDDFTISADAIGTAAVPETSALLMWATLCGTVLVGWKLGRGIVGTSP